MRGHPGEHVLNPEGLLGHVPHGTILSFSPCWISNFNSLQDRVPAKVVSLTTPNPHPIMTPEPRKRPRSNEFRLSRYATPRHHFEEVPRTDLQKSVSLSEKFEL
jgi:hypothetical protein